MSTGQLWPWIEAPCTRCEEQSLGTGTNPILEVPVFFPSGGPEEHWSDLHRALCLACYRIERSSFGREAGCQHCEQQSRCQAGKPPFKGTCAVVATMV